MSIQLKKSFDQYFELDYNRLAWSSSDIADNLHVLKPLNDKKERFQRLQEFIQFYDNYASVKHPETEQKCLELFNINFSDIDPEVLQNHKKSIFQFSDLEGLNTYYNGTAYLMGKWHEIRDSLSTLSFEQIDRYSSKDVFNGMIYDELPFFLAYYNTIVDFKDGKGFERVSKDFANTPHLKNYETLLDCFLTRAYSNAFYGSDYPNQKGNLALAKLLNLRAMELEKSKLVA
jgi:hypothetical protein